MMRATFAAILIAAAPFANAGSAMAQVFGPVLPQAPRPPIVGCAPGQPCQVAPQFGFRCLTPQFWCGLPQPGPLGVSCYCNSPMGPVPGFVGQ
jgi:hypothetical protein